MKRSKAPQATLTQVEAELLHEFACNARWTPPRRSKAPAPAAAPPARRAKPGKSKTKGKTHEKETR